MRRSHRRLAGRALLLLALASPAAADGIRALDGTKLEAPPLAEEFRREQESRLAEAEARRAAEPDDAEAWIWIGRRLAYLGRYAEALRVYGEGHERFPDDARFLRHRGHRLVSLRRFAEAEADLERAAAMVSGQPDVVEPDGLPNARGIPTSTLQTNIWYHLGLARYLRGDWAGAVAAYRRCRELAANPDMLVAASYWLYLSARRAGDPSAADLALDGVEPDLDIVENDAYHELLLAFAAGTGVSRLLERAAADRSGVAYPTTAYGVGAWWLVEGERERSRRLFASILEAPAVTAFGYIAAEAELAR